MLNLQQLKNSYLSKKINKWEFIRKIHKQHAKLFDYSSFIKDTQISKVEILDNKVLMISRKNKIKMVCDELDERTTPIEILNFGDYEKQYFTFFTSILKNLKVFFDIGANIGWYSLNAAKIYPDLKVFAFEPIPKTFNYLKENIKMNGLKNVKSFNFGFSDSNKDVFFYYYQEGSGNASEKPLSKNKNQIKIPCKLKKLDDFSNNRNYKINVIKCDVEGAELTVFKGALKTLSNDKPIVFSELLRKWSRFFGYNPNAVISLFNSLNYRCFYIKDTRLYQIKKINGVIKETNFVFLHEEKHSQIINRFKK